MLLASDLHTLHHPNGLLQWILAFGGYTVWSLAQQFLLQGYFLARLVRLGLATNAGNGHLKGEPNVWSLTPLGERVAQRLQMSMPVPHEKAA